MNSFVYSMSALNEFLSQADIFELPALELKFSNKSDMLVFEEYFRRSFEDDAKYKIKLKQPFNVYGFKIELTTK